MQAREGAPNLSVDKCNQSEPFRAAQHPEDKFYQSHARTIRERLTTHKVKQAYPWEAYTRAKQALVCSTS
jgi:hypothetical protein